MDNLKSKTGKAFGWELVGNYGGQISGFIISIFLARLLDPEEFGLVGMSMVFISILKVFMDMGFASALIHNKDNTSITYSSIFYLNIFAGLMFTILIFFAAPLIGEFYENNIVTDLVRLLSITFFIGSFNIVQGTILRKNLDFKSLTYRSLISQLIGGLIAVIFAWIGYGVYALVIQQIVVALINTVLLWKISGWYPKLEFSWAEIKKLSGFSVYVFAAQSVNQIIRQSDTLIIGKVFSPATLGFFSRANSLNSLINKNAISSFQKVFFPALSTIQNDDERFERVFLKVINLVSGISIFLTGVFFLSGEEIIIGLFGEKWQPSVVIFQIIIIKGFTYPISAMIVNAFLAKGKSKENFHYGNIRKVLQITPFYFAFVYGFKEYLFATVGASLIAWVLNMFFVNHSLKISLRAQIKVVFPTLLFSSLLVFLISLLFPPDGSLIMAILEVFIFSAGFLCFLWLINSPLLLEAVYYLGIFKNRFFRKDNDKDKK